MVSARTRGLLAGRIGGVAGTLVAGQVLLGITYVAAAREMGPAGLGLVATCFAIGTVASTVFNGGLNFYLVREIASGRIDLALARAMLVTKRRFVALLLVPTVAASLAIMGVSLAGCLLGLSAWALLEAQTSNALLRAQEQFRSAAFAQVGGRAAGLLITVAGILVGSADLGLAAGLVLGFVVEAFINRLVLGPINRPASPAGPMWAENRRALSYGLLALAGVGQQLDAPLVTAGGGAVAGGIYAAAGRLLGPLLFLSSSLALVGAPWLAQAGRDADKLRAEEDRIGRTALVLSLGPLLAAAVGPLLIPWILGSRFEEAGPAFALLAVGAALSTINQGMATILQNRRSEQSVALAIGIGLVLGLIVTYVLAVLAGPTWAAAGFGVSNLWIVAHLGIVLRRVRREADTVRC